MTCKLTCRRTSHRDYYDVFVSNAPDAKNRDAKNRSRKREKEKRERQQRERERTRRETERAERPARGLARSLLQQPVV